MALYDDLRAIAEKIPPSHQPTASELGAIVGAAIAYQEHGKKLLDAANSDDPQDLAELLGGTPEKSSTPPPSGKAA